MTRQEHMEWCKQRALEYLNHGDTQNAIASMMSDLRKHPETENHPGAMMMLMLKMSGQLNEVSEVRKFIEGFN